MFTGIVEAMGSLVKTEAKGTNVEFWFTSPFTQELKVDQSLAHNGVCLTVVEIQGDQYRVTGCQRLMGATVEQGHRNRERTSVRHFTENT